MKFRKEIIDGILPTNHYGYHFRLVEIEDAEFILSLRSNEKLSRHINTTSAELDEQINWLKEYKVREKNGEDFYILCLKEDKETKQGVVRIYNINGTEFEIGSWVFKSDADPNVAILADLFTFSLAYEQLNLKTCNASVRKANKRVLWYTKSFDPILKMEDELNFYFEIGYDNYKIQRDKLLKMLL